MVMISVVWYFDTLLQYTCNVYIIIIIMCVHSYCWISENMCTCFNYNLHAFPERLWYSVHAGSTQYLYYTCTLRHQHLWCALIIQTCILCSTYRIVRSGMLVIVVMLLELNNFWHWVPTSTTMHLWVIKEHTLHTILGVLGINSPTSVRSLCLTL